MKCPNCSGEIGRFDLSPNCKHCGVNIFFSQQKKLLTDDAKKCELEYAVFHILVAKLKAAFIKGPVPILRIVAMVAAIGAILVPFATVSCDVALFSSRLSFGGLGVYNAFSDGTLMALFNLTDYAPGQVKACLILLSLMVAVLVVGLGIFVTLILSFINIQKSARIMRILAAVDFAFCMAAAVNSCLIPSVMSKSGFLSGSIGLGSFACMGVFAFIFILNHLVVKKNIQPEIKEVDIKRLEMNKKVKSGAVSLDDLSLPVFESEEERLKRLEEENESKQLIEKAKGGEALG